ncbi:MAG TPA: hypothetical protein VJM10_04855 [Candidatus Methylomirabilis sp.]|nr:hypothetical protein [Candidatus Methylomirabilis sp.]
MEVAELFEIPAYRGGLALVALQVSAPPMTVWEELTSPHRRQAWEGLLSIDEESPGGRRGVGTLSSCPAERLSSVEEILEWRPFEAFARSSKHPGLGRLSMRAELRADLEDAMQTQVSVAWYGAAALAGEAEAQRQRLVAHASAVNSL